MVVPLPGVESIVKVPPSCSTFLVMVFKPIPSEDGALVLLKPTPLSINTILIWSFKSKISIEKEKPKPFY